MALIWSWGRGELVGSPCRGSGCENSGLHEVVVSKRRTVGLSDRGWVQRGRHALFVDGVWGERSLPIGATRLNAFAAPTAKRDPTGEVPTVSLAKMCGRTNQRFRTTHTSCSQCNDRF